jgi:cytochrome c-type biogenesis protein CcmE
MKRRHKRISFIIAGLAVVGIATYLIASALNQNIAFFFSPSEIVAKQAPVGKTMRMGGLVENGSKRYESDGLTVRFAVTDTSKTIPVVYKGILPDLFKEGRGCVVRGRMENDGVFHADEVLAKHDENYMPPEAGSAVDAAKHEKEAAKTVVDH